MGYQETLGLNQPIRPCLPNALAERDNRVGRVAGESET